MADLFDILNQPLFVQGVEWHIEIAQLEEDAAKAPDIGPAVMAVGELIFGLVAQNFGTLVQQGAYVLDDSGTPRILTGYTKITNLHGIILAAEKYITGFQIPM